MLKWVVASSRNSSQEFSKLSCEKLRRPCSDVSTSRENVDSGVYFETGFTRIHRSDSLDSISRLSSQVSLTYGNESPDHNSTVGFDSSLCLEDLLCFNHGRLKVTLVSFM